MAKRNPKAVKPKNRSHQADGGEVVLASRTTVVSNGIVSIMVADLRTPHFKPWDDEELAETYASGAR